MSRAFPLAGLLRVRERAEERAASELAAARRAEQAVRDRQRATREALAGSTLPEGTDRLAWIAAVASRSSLALLLQEAENDVALAEQHVAEQAQLWSHARREVRAIDRLAERHDETERALEAHAEQVTLDEVASRLTTETTRTPGGGA
ncbi:flagellar export protein FliJ [Cellulomonas persica]|uniref:Flagellar FliJ protein n=1 Tax=Cellulomonas persica TaxID=76861 RepID=A0A510UXG5_9CELL|nr:flagellar export protein FliJ [Cellulomonas persica]GEK19348.1 hypothetical protein CPE01_30810 [Cellulomonas persica]